jgi:hypothetical protein
MKIVLVEEGFCRKQCSLLLRFGGMPNHDIYLSNMEASCRSFVKARAWFLKLCGRHLLAAHMYFPGAGSLPSVFAGVNK